ncbi:hypothetical protein SBF1_5130007 [Candidatus Desulfosporosinus infrequens]|uniref:Collagen triple helix repeat protein n=1 Tax=Candidatus Desulfosporosinus infrequens TaxID=2043169 RepID=A0A2U3LI72_9FIRM|nr:hypothetical protein SBF1_5130007 [Candidatus Desulfosporosinus infrequens]
MLSFTTGLIDNPSVPKLTTASSMINLKYLKFMTKPSSTVTVRITNNDSVSVELQIFGYFMSGNSKIPYVADEVRISPSSVVTRNYFAQSDAYEFQFSTDSCKTEISVWGTDANGKPNTVHRLMPAELNSIGHSHHHKGATGATGATGSTGATGATGTTGATGATGATGSTGATGATGTTCSTGATGAGSAFIETLKIGDINALIPFNAGEGNSQVIGALAFNGQQTTITKLATYVIQLGANTGTFQLAVLQPASQTTATVIGVTTVATFLTADLFILPLTAPVTLDGNTTYYLAAYNQIVGSTLGGRNTGSGTVANAFPINFRAQNLPLLTVGQLINTSDVSLLLSPYIAGLV